MDQSFFGVSCVDINQEPNPRMRQAMCNQVERCVFDVDDQVCVSTRRGSVRTRSGDAGSSAVNLRTLKRTLKSNPGKARAVLTALSDYTDNVDTEPMVAKIIRWAVLPLLPLVTYVAMQEKSDIVSVIVKILTDLEKVLKPKTFQTLWFDYIYPALMFGMKPKMVPAIIQGAQLPFGPLKTRFDDVLAPGAEHELGEGEYDMVDEVNE